MAFRLKAELGAVALLLVVIAVGLRMWDPGFASRYGYNPGGDTLFHGLVDAQARYRAAYIADSLYRALPATGAVLRAEGLGADDSAAVARAFARDTAGARAGVRAGLFTMPTRGTEYMPGSLDSVRTSALARATGFGHRWYEMFTGRDDAGAWCAAAATSRGLNTIVRHARQPAGPHREWWAAGTASPLGPCRWWLRYGPPGSPLDAWLAAGRYGLTDGDTTILGPDLAMREWVFFRQDAWSYGRPSSMRCRAGDARACVDALDPAPRRTTTMAAYGRDWGGFFGSGEGAMFAHIEREFGAERFARFWQSDADVETAFASAFGVPFDAWLLRWVQERYGVVETGPRVDAVSVLLSLLTIVVLVWLGLRVVQHRSIG